MGAIRRVATRDRIIRQVLLAHSDLDRSYTYAICDPSPLPVRDYVATIRIARVVEGDRAFVEWAASFDCAAEDRDRWVEHFETEGFARWLGALRRFIGAGKPGRPA